MTDYGKTIFKKYRTRKKRFIEEKPMKFFNFEIVIEKEEKDEGYFAYSPSLPGCFSNGKTIEETKKTFAKPFSNTSCPCGSTHSQYHRKSVLCMLKNFKKVLVTIPVHTGCDIGRGLAVKILKDAGFSIDDYMRLK
jgi:predicted RNA binding protein YcfA (HicA-like mRNA interferase family)